jgi:uncharacterized protein YhjY with autotransporter beta-barrel domain
LPKIYTVKRISWSRKAILRAIHAALIALLLGAGASKSHAQTFTAPFVVNGSAVSTNANGTFTSPVGFYDPTNTYSSISVGSGVTINSTSSYGGPIIGVSFSAFSAVIGATTSSFSNQGSLNLNTNSGSYLATVGLNQGATSVDVTNSGSITNTGLANVLNVGSALYIVSTSGNATVDNTGTLSTTGGNGQNALWLQSTSGNIAVTNAASATISDDTGSAIYTQASSSGAITVTNDGIVNAAARAAINADSATGALQLTNNGTVNDGGVQTAISGSSAGPITVVNTGHIVSTSAAGVYVEGSAGAISVTNSGSISAGDYGLAATQRGSGNISITNTGTITSTYAGIYSYFYNPSPASALVIHNTGPITSTGSGIYTFSPTTLYNSGNITAATNAIDVPSGSIVTLAGRPVINGTIVGGSTSASTSQLIFNLNIPSANLAAARTQLNAEIAAYDAQSGGDYTFTVDGLTFDISNFDYGNLTDDLTAQAAARLYRNTRGFQSEGLVLDELNTSNATAARILAALGNVPDSGLVNALSELSPKELEVFRNVAFDNNTFNAAQINNHLANLRDGLTGFDSSALTVQDSSMDPTLNQVRDHLLAYNPAAAPGLISDSGSIFGLMDPKDMKSAQVNTMPVDRWSTFIAGNVILANLSNNLNLQDSNYTTGAVTAGADYRLDDHFTVGALFAYAHTDAGLDDRNSSATVDSYSPGIYGSYVDGPWYGNFLGAYTRNAYTEDRVIDIAGLNGDNHGSTSGDQGSANLTGGYEFQKGAFKFGPVASLQYVHLAIDSIQEQGPAALDINSRDQDSLRSLLGVEGRFNAMVGSVSLTPHLSVSWQHEYLDNSRGITSQFVGAGGGSFSVETDTPDRDAAFIDVGLDATVSKDVTVFVASETQVGQNNFFAQSAEGGVKIGF